MKNAPRRLYYTNAGACLLLLLFGLQLVSTVRQESLTRDEGDHIFAGYMSWKTHDFGLNPENPPLMKMPGTFCRYIAQSSQLTKQKDFAGALAAAQQAVKIAPNEYQPEMGDALVAVGRKDDAREAYGRALEVVNTMEPQAQETLRPTVEKKIVAR